MVAEKYWRLNISDYIIPHFNNSFLFQYEVTRSLNRDESPDQTVQLCIACCGILANTGLLLYLHR